MADIKKIGHYRVEIHQPKEVYSLGDQSRVRFDLKWTSDKGATVHIRPEWGPNAKLDAEPAYGLGKTLREHEQSHIDDYLKILTKRQPPMTPGHKEYGAYMDHTIDLMSTCSQFHTDQVKKPKDPLWKECENILKW